MPSVVRKSFVVLGSINSTLTSVARSPADDRKDAPRYYAMLLLRQAHERGLKDPELGKRLGSRHKGHINQIRNGTLGVGFDVWFAIADWQCRAPGELLDEALSWWKTAGRRWRAEVLEEQARAAREAATPSLESEAEALVAEVVQRKSGRPPDKARVPRK